MIIPGKKAGTDNAEFGSKACGLIYLSGKNFTVPEFYILPYSVIQQIKTGQLQLYRVIESWQAEFSIKADARWAVRSSAAVEDGLVRSYAGQFVSVTNVQLPGLEEAIQKVLRGYDEVHRAYHEQQSFSYGVIIQEMIDADYSGVVFSHDPNCISDQSVLINLIPGLGENLVSGKEIAFAVKEQNKHLVYLNAEEEEFAGQLFTDRLISVTKSGKEIKNETAAVLPVLVAGTKKLFKSKKIPLDIEFCISRGKLFWLQVRPVTGGGEEPSIWDNTSAEANFPGLTLPLSISLLRFSFKEAYSQMALHLGMKNTIFEGNKIWLENMCGEINGTLFYNVTAWQKLTYQAPFGKKFSNSLTKVWGMEKADFIRPGKRNVVVRRFWIFVKFLSSFFFLKKHKKNYLWHYNDVMTRFEKANLDALNHEQLITTFNGINKQFQKNWLSPVLNGFYTMVVFSMLKRRITKSEINNTHPNFINDILFSTGDVISVTIVREFQKLIMAIKQEAELAELFLQKEPPEIKRSLESGFKSFNEKMLHYIEQYGDRSDAGELKMETINYKEDPLTFIVFLKENAKLEYDRTGSHASFDYRMVLKEHYPVNMIRRWFLKFLIKSTIVKIKERENYRFMRTKTFSLLRRIFRAMDADLFRNGYLDERGDSLYLEIHEILDRGQVENYRSIIRERKERYRAYKGQVLPNRYIKTKTGFMPVEVENFSAGPSQIVGTGCCSGVVKGEVLILGDQKVSDLEAKGKILIANYFEPGWINLFSQAAGIISERGNLLSHTAILCREMGIPSIVGAKGVMRRIKSGDIIQMNGATGKINTDV